MPSNRSPEARARFFRSGSLVELRLMVFREQDRDGAGVSPGAHLGVEPVSTPELQGAPFRVEGP